MRHTWPFLILVAAAGGAAGVAIAGSPEPADRFIIDPTSVTTTTLDAVVVPTPVPST